MSRGDIILRLVDVERTYETKEGRKIVALNKVTTSFKRGEFVAVVGKSGSGKSTLINILGGLDTPNSGDYFLEGNNIVNINEGHWDAIRNEKIGFIFQEYHLIEYLSVYKNVEIALKYQHSSNRKTKDAKIKQILTDVGIIDHIHKLPGQLSGGQRQRVAIARALVKDPAIILADEPTGALDHKTSENVIELIKGLSKERLVIVVTHDRGIANEHATRIIELSEGEFVNDLIKEDIEQTYQNVYRKIKPTNLSLGDKLELTFNKIKSQLLRTFFTALSLALAFSFTILFSGIERGVSDSYDAYFEALNKANSYAFSLVPIEDAITVGDYEKAVSDLQGEFNAIYDDVDSEIVTGYTPDVAISEASGGAERTYNEPLYPDMLSQYKVRLFDQSHIETYSYNDLFIGESLYPQHFDELMVTTKFYQEYFMLGDDIGNLTEFVNETILIPEYTFSMEEGIFGVEDYLNNLVELEDGSIVESNPLLVGGQLEVRYLDLYVPMYCYNYDELNEYYQRECNSTIRDEQFNRYFESVEEFIAYLDDFKVQVDEIDEDYFDILLRSSAIYYVVDEKDAYLDPTDDRYIERVYRALYNEAILGTSETEFRDAIFKSQATFKEMVITGIIENDNEAIIYMDYKTYNNLFIEGYQIVNLDGYFSINLEGGINNNYEPIDIALDNFALPLIEFETSNGYADDFRIIRKESKNPAEGEICAIYSIDNVLLDSAEFENVLIAGDVFYIADYSGCKVNSDSYHYLNSISILFGVFFNVLMFISIIFFNILLQVILSERIGEIGIYRSVGSTSKDIKVLFFIEIIFEVVLAAIMSIGIIYYANNVINDVFITVINQGSGVITFAGMKLSIGNDGTITNISFFNLAFYIVIVFVLLGILSNRNVSKLANTKPIDILREVD
ncbi:Macrolide export ATP-binding/permease protein MacB [Candidatus Izimaplasma bacterium HR1]|jgi:ABC-type lipoprotein export system ATPase subunit|uniref:ABC transporter ATP-binding protein/permease n=1 Tax=Candidatus Izimoplasma sp. HR1 TaxID=1541959 RepID=UPI0004F60A2C|nr:Macrolide export ATP-binding/permease protein MacB [Candidatus Izimaplasma bacterium HR1]